jgi:hypothetical protein
MTFSFLITEVSTEVSGLPADFFAPTFGEQVEIRFRILAPADMEVRIYEEDDDALANLLRTIPLAAAPAGINSLFWDGKDAAAQFVSDGFYAYVIVADDGTFTHTYDLPRGPVPGGGSASPITSFNTFQNDFFKVLVQNVGTTAARMRLEVTPPGGSLFFAFDDWPLPLGETRLLVFDGRDLNGDILPAGSTLFDARPFAIKPNVVIVERGAPEVKGPEFEASPAVPNVEVKSNPYLIHHSYDQVSTLAYCLDQDAFVTIKILKPGFSDTNDPGGVVAILDDGTTLRAAVDCDGGGDPHQVEWRGYDASDTNAILASETGAYTFTIEAANALQASLTTLYRGVVQVRQ